MVENVIWPAYLDADRSRSEGRRVPLSDAVGDPAVGEIAEAVQQLGYDAVIERDQTYPREHDPRGRVLVQGADEDSKNDLVKGVAAYVGVLRS